MDEIWSLYAGKGCTCRSDDDRKPIIAAVISHLIFVPSFPFSSVLKFLRLDWLDWRREALLEGRLSRFHSAYSVSGWMNVHTT